MRVLIVDDHIVVRLGLRTLIQSQPDMEVAGDCGSGAEALVALESVPVDLVLLDVRMPEWNGVETLRRIRERHPQTRILMLSSFGSEEDIYQSLQGGAAGYILKNSGSDELLRAIREIHAGGTFTPPGVAERYADRSSRAELTDREMDILKLVFRGLTNKEIAHELAVAESTVKNHMNNVMFKLGAKDRTQASHVALVRGLLSVE